MLEPTIEREDLYQLVYGYTKIYPTFMRYIDYKTPRLIRRKDFEARDKKAFSRTATELLQKPTDINSELSLLTSLRRTKTTISDIILCNNFDQFATFTFKSDRYDIQFSRRKMSDWLKSQQIIHGKFDYLIVPEFHKDKVAIHFHALLKGYTGNLTPTKKLIGGRKVFNISSYRSGFSTLVMIDNVEKVSSYVKKYITKDMPLFPGRKRYWTSQGLQRPELLPQLSETKTPLDNPFISYSLIYENNAFAIWHTTATIKTLSTISKGIKWRTLLTYRNSELLSLSTLNKKHHQNQDISTQPYQLSLQMATNSITLPRKNRRHYADTSSKKSIHRTRILH
jgi:hypothetical protein